MARSKVVQLRDCTIRGTPAQIRALLQQLTSLEATHAVVVQMRGCTLDTRKPSTAPQGQTA